MDVHRTKLLLLVDDEARSARMLAKMLREDGFDVEVTFNGAAAISRLTRLPVPDALLTDFRMPNVDGVTVAKYARSVSPTMPIVFLTGYPQLVSRRIASLGAQVHAKPLDYQALSRDVGRMLSEHLGPEMARVLPEPRND